MNFTGHRGLPRGKKPEKNSSSMRSLPETGGGLVPASAVTGVVARPLIDAHSPIGADLNKGRHNRPGPNGPGPFQGSERSGKFICCVPAK